MMPSPLRQAFVGTAGALIALAASAAPVQAQRIRPAPPPIAARIDSGAVPPRDQIIAPTPPGRLLARERRPTPAEPVRAMTPGSPPPPVAAIAADAVEASPPPLERQAPPPPAAAIAASAPVLNININSTPPIGATARCKDGSYLTGTPSDERCAGRGGLVVLLPPARSGPSRAP